MRSLIVSLVMTMLVSCDKVIDVHLPEYKPELVVEMYIEEGKPLTCKLTESIAYTDTAIIKSINDAVVVFSDGTSNDTLKNFVTNDTTTGRFYNYYNPRILVADITKSYSLKVSDHQGREITATTGFLPKITAIDTVDIRQSVAEPDSFSVGVRILDAADMENYYRFLIGKKFNIFESDPTDFRVSDIAFNGQAFSFFSEADYQQNDTVTIRVYSMRKEHFEYVESVRNARRANFNPFSQPGRITSNIMGGLGIFTTIQYDERKVIIK